jgi:hypothetical protein
MGQLSLTARVRSHLVEAVLCEGKRVFFCLEDSIEKAVAANVCPCSLLPLLFEYLQITLKTRSNYRIVFS